MKVMLLGGHHEFHRALVERHGVELFALTGNMSLASLADPRIWQRLFPYTSRAKLDPQASQQIRHAVQAVQPDILHLFHGRPLGNALLATLGLPHPPRLVSFRGIVRQFTFRDPGDLLTFGHPRVAAHTCASAAIRDSLIASGLDSTRCFTVYDTSGHHPHVGRPGLLPFGIPPDAFVVGMVAALRPVKGADLLLEAALQCADLPNVYWVLIGQVLDPRVEQLARHPRLASRVKLLGFQPQAASLIGGADLFVMPSREEGLCLALLEAMSQGVCPIVSDAGGMQEVARPGQEGLVVPRNDVAALSQAIRAMYFDTDRRRTFAAAAARRIAANFTPAGMADRVMDCYRLVLANDRGARNRVLLQAARRLLTRPGSRRNAA